MHARDAHTLIATFPVSHHARFCDAQINRSGFHGHANGSARADLPFAPCERWEEQVQPVIHKLRARQPGE